MTSPRHEGPKPSPEIPIKRVHKGQRLTKDEWLAKGRELFGDDFFQWRFVCPSCGHVQTPEMFRGLAQANNSITPDTARFNCIGRYDGHLDTPMCSGKSPCNYTSGGLLNISPILVVDDEGREYTSFAFHEPTTKAEPAS